MAKGFHDASWIEECWNKGFGCPMSIGQVWSLVKVGIDKWILIMTSALKQFNARKGDGSMRHQVGIRNTDPAVIDVPVCHEDFSIST
jgi:hypothetical protein